MKLRGAAPRARTLIRPDDAYNRELVENVHPPSWVNPTPSGRYNLVVIGAGTAGLVSAAGAAWLGAKVALIERHLMGGDCLNFGCVPSKALIRAARAVRAIEEASAFGVRAQGEADFSAAMARLRRLRSGIAHNDSARRLAGMGVDVFLGEAKFVSPDAVDVDGKRLRFSRAVVATGTRAAALPIPGLEEAGYLTNETVFSLTELPRRLLVIGAGPTGCELAQAFRRFGSEVTLVSLDPRLLPKEDADAEAVIAAQFEREGIDTALGARIRSVEHRGGQKTITFERHGRREEASGDEILVTVGRAPNLEGLGLESAGIDFDKAGVMVDDHLRASNRRVYAAGDIGSTYKFTHTADALARIAVQNALFLGHKKASALVIPWSTFTDPEVAHVGLYEEEAKRRGLDVATFTVPLREIDRAVLDEESAGFARVHVERKSGRVLGATMVARHAGEMISEMSLAMTAGLSLKTVARTVHPYPTQCEAWKRLADTWNLTRLTPRVRGLLERYLEWRR